MNLRPKYVNANIKIVEENIKEFVYKPGQERPSKTKNV